MPDGKFDPLAAPMRFLAYIGGFQAAPVQKPHVKFLINTYHFLPIFFLFTSTVLYAIEFTREIAFKQFTIAIAALQTGMVTATFLVSQLTMVFRRKSYIEHYDMISNHATYLQTLNHAHIHALMERFQKRNVQWLVVLSMYGLGGILVGSSLYIQYLVFGRHFLAPGTNSIEYTVDFNIGKMFEPEFIYVDPFYHGLFGLYICLCVVTLIVSAVTDTVILITFFGFGIVLLESVECRFKELGPFGSGAETVDFLAESVSLHARVLRYVRILEDKHKWIILIRFVCFTLNICIVLFELIIVQEESRMFQILQLTIGVGAILNLSLYCTYGNMTIVQSERLPVAIFHSGWQSMNMRDKWKVLTLLAVSIRPVRYAPFGKPTELSFQSLRKILNASYSAFTLLATMDRKFQ